MDIRRRTVLVEGTTDANLFEMAARFERTKSGADLLGSDLAILAAGERERGGTLGVIRKLIVFRELSRIFLLPNGKPVYRFVGVLDNDHAGRDAIRQARQLDSSILEYKDVFRLRPVMPLPGGLDPTQVQRSFEDGNAMYKGLDWEIEDFIPQGFTDALLADFPNAVRRTVPQNGKIHRDYTPDGKARLHHFVRKHAIHSDLAPVIELLKAIRHYLGLR